jgi:tetratricopeptide (TPR) repeat protein
MRNKIGRKLFAALTLTLCTGAIGYYAHRNYLRSEASRHYREALQPVYHYLNPFCPEAQFGHFDSLIATRGDEYVLTGELLKATDLLEMGKEQQAITLLERTLEGAGRPASSAAGSPDPVYLALRSTLALAWLRKGERYNCIYGHSSASCVFPIKKDGVYTDPYASQKAIDLYLQVLQDKPNDLTTRWLLNVAYMTLGRYPSGVPLQWLIPGLDADTSDALVKPFRNVAAALGLNANRNMSGGAIVDDFDKDGYLDIITSSMDLGESMHYYHNNRDGTFTDLSGQSGLSAIKGGLNIIQADYNNDGYTDILVLRGAWAQEFGRQPKTLLRNNGDGTFTDVTVESGILSFCPTQTGVWADFNNDGWLDLYIGNETTNSMNPNPAELYINNQDGTFTNVAHEANCDKLGFTKGVVSADYDKDGWPDLFLSNLDGHKMLLRNKAVKGRIPQFEDVSHKAGLDKDLTPTFPTWFWDYDNDGWPDIFVCGYAFKGHLAEQSAAEALHLPQNEFSKMHLYHNNRDGTFTDVSTAAGLDRAVFGMGANFGDIDNDGWLDMYIGTGNPDFTSLIPNRMFKNINGGRFVDVTRAARVGNLQKGHGVAFADIDNDGSQDIFEEMGGPYAGDAYFNSLYVNPGQNNNGWISILLEGTKSNRSAIGAHLAVTFTEDGRQRTVYRDVGSGGSFGASTLRREIGLGKAEKIDELSIQWPGTGTVQVFKNLRARQFLRIKEGDDQVQVMDLKRLRFPDQAGPMNMAMPTAK